MSSDCDPASGIIDVTNDQFMTDRYVASPNYGSGYSHGDMCNWILRVLKTGNRIVN